MAAPRRVADSLAGWQGRRWHRFICESLQGATFQRALRCSAIAVYLIQRHEDQLKIVAPHNFVQCRFRTEVASSPLVNFAVIDTFRKSTDAAHLRVSY